MSAPSDDVLLSVSANFVSWYHDASPPHPPFYFSSLRTGLSFSPCCPHCALHLTSFTQPHGFSKDPVEQKRIMSLAATWLLAGCSQYCVSQNIANT
jgi:hypothetical protein